MMTTRLSCGSQPGDAVADNYKACAINILCYEFCHYTIISSRRSIAPGVHSIDIQHHQGIAWPLDIIHVGMGVFP